MPSPENRNMFQTVARVNAGPKARRSVSIGILASVCLVSGVGVANAGTVTATAENGKAVAPKIGKLAVLTKALANAAVTTEFKFHPGQTVTTPLVKQLNTLAQVTHTYNKNELHGTGGSAQHTTLPQATNQGVAILDTIVGKIDPVGASNPPMNVSIFASISDPFVFSSTSPSAFFAPDPNGFDYSLSLFAGTAFPDAFADMASMTFQGRLAPGVVDDPSAFWGSPTGVIDVYSLTLTSDASHNVTAALTFGAGTSDFALDYKNQLGTPFDPTNAADVSAIEAAIEAGFSSGKVLLDMNDLFTVGFVPNSSLSEYTLGGKTSVELGADEAVPEPSSLLLATAGCLAVGIFHFARNRRAGSLVGIESTPHPG